jgi:homoserine dehydrogenase
LSPDVEELVTFARDRNAVVRLIGRARARDGRLRMSVAPRLVDPGSRFHKVRGTSKLAVFRTKGFGDFAVEARSGAEAIARVILDDVLATSGG